MNENTKGNVRGYPFEEVPYLKALIYRVLLIYLLQFNGEDNMENTVIKM